MVKLNNCSRAGEKFLIISNSDERIVEKFVQDRIERITESIKREIFCFLFKNAIQATLNEFIKIKVIVTAYNALYMKSLLESNIILIPSRDFWEVKNVADNEVKTKKTIIVLK